MTQAAKVKALCAALTVRRIVSVDDLLLARIGAVTNETAARGGDCFTPF
jgi:hypothetical protein